MPWTALPRAPLLFCISALLACGGKPDPGTTEGSSTGGSSTGPGATTSGAMTSSASSGGATTGEMTTGATTGGVTCDLVLLTNAAAEVLGPVKDCGIVDPWMSTLAEWQAAVSCVLDASAAEMPFKMVAWRQGIDSEIGTGYFGVAAESYQRGTIDYDSLGAAIQRSCTAITATPACTVAIDQPCLTCQGADAGTELCSNL